MRLKRTITRELKEEQLKPISQRSIIHSKKLQTDGTYLVEYTIYNMSSYEVIVNQLVKEKYEYIDVLVNNAGIAIDTLFEDKTKKQFMKTLEINLVAPFLLSKLFGEDMFKNKTGNIINISSTNGIDSYYQYSLDYDSSKAGLINLTHNLSNHFAPYVRVNCVCPGWVKTPMNSELGEEYIKSEEEKILLNRFANPEEIANLVYFLSSNDASYINDSIIKIDGGVKHGIN